jgi:phage/plasmid-like protein (TIGR03299 family)
MSKETSAWLNTNTLVGFTEKRGTAWHYRADLQTPDPITGHIGNHYPGAIPVDHVLRRLFNWTAESADLYTMGPNPHYNPDQDDDVFATLNDPEVSSALDALPKHVAQLLRSKIELADRLVNSPDEYFPVEGRQAIKRSDAHAVFGIFKSGYEIHNFQDWLLGTISTILDDDVQTGSAGLLSGGAKAWVSVEVPDNFTTPEGVEYRPNLLATTSHDGTLATTFKRVIQLVVCDNTLDMALSEKGQTYKVKHSRYSAAKLASARDALNIIYQDADDFAAQVKALAETSVSDEQWSDFLEMHIPMGDDLSNRANTFADHKREQFTELWHADPRVEPWAGTAFGVVQAGNTWRQHLSIIRGTASRAERNQEAVLSGKAGEYDALVLADLNKVLSNA